MIKAAHMPRISRASGIVMPVTLLIAKTAARPVFHKAQDYEAFLSILAIAKDRLPVKILHSV
jgi:hypothetical protein